MDKLPREVFLIIVGYLPMRAQRQLACVNRQWCDWIRRNNFFEVVSLYTGGIDDDDEMPELQLPLEFFKETKYGLQTKFLTIEGEKMILDDIWDITRTFPNIERLAWNPPQGVMYEDEFKKAVKKKWKQLKRIDEGHNSAFTKCILSSRANAAHLEKIRVGYAQGRFEEYEDYISTSFHEDLPFLDHVPQLKALTIENSNISMELLVAIHEYLPNLKKLRLIDPSDANFGDFYQDMDEEEEDAIKKVEKLESLCVVVKQHRFDRQTYGPQMMDFISHTYTNLTAFKFRFDEWLYPSTKVDEDEDFNATLCSALSKWHNLKTFDFQLYSLDSDNVQAMNASGIKLENLTLYVDVDEQLSQAQYSHLLSCPDVVKDLKKLRLCQRGYLKTSGESSVEFIRNLPKLETLAISTALGATSINGPILLAGILNTAPQLKHLQASEFYSVLVNPFRSKVPSIDQPTQLVSLTISDIQLCLTKKDCQALNDMFEDILSHCPLLEKFTTNINAYTKASGAAARGMSVIFDFKKLLRMQEVVISSWYETDFKVTIEDQVSIFHKTSEVNTPKQAVDNESIYISIIANKATAITTDVLY